MTLHTRLAVTTPGVAAEALFHRLVTLCEGTEEHYAQREVRPSYHSHEQGVTLTAMPLDLGLLALCDMRHREDGALLPLGRGESYYREEVKASTANHEARDEAWHREHGHLWRRDKDKAHELWRAMNEEHPNLSYVPPAYIEVSFDTGYGYRTPLGASCGDLHAWLLRELGKYLEEQGAEWTWYDESGWGWYEEWQDNPEALARAKGDPRWGTLGDPDDGDPLNTTPVVTRDARQDFLSSLMPALQAQGFVAPEPRPLEEDEDLEARLEGIKARLRARLEEEAKEAEARPHSPGLRGQEAGVIFSEDLDNGWR